MSDLYAFLNPVDENEEKDVVISKRFLDKDGTPQPFRIKALTQADNERIMRSCTKVSKENGQRVEKMDNGEYTRRLVVEATVLPNFADKSLCDRYKTLNPYDVPGKMLRAGEFAALSKEIMQLSGFNQSFDEAVEEAKN